MIDRRGAIETTEATLAALRRALRQAIASRDAANRWGLTELGRLETRQIARIEAQIAQLEAPDPTPDAP